jgi:hypothetical protein
MTTATSPSGLRLGAIGPTEAPGLVSVVGVRPFSPGGVPGMGTKVPSFREVSGECTGTSSSSWIEGLNKSYANTPRRVDS